MRALWFACMIAAAPLALAEVTVEKPWARATPPNTKVGVVYLTMRSTQADEIISMSSSVAERIEIHTTVSEGGTIKMRPVPLVSLPAGESVRFESGGLHIMLIGLRAPLTAGSKLKLNMELRSGERKSIDIPVLSPTDSPPTR